MEGRIAFRGLADAIGLPFDLVRRAALGDRGGVCLADNQISILLQQEPLRD